MISTELTAIKKCKAIVLFGPPTRTSGTRAGEYYQVTLDPEMVSPSGEFIRFGANDGDEIHGWQRIEAMTVCEILGEYLPDGTYPDADGKSETLEMMKVA